MSNELSRAEAERLAVLAEELGEVQQVIGKILRHGYESYNPYKNVQCTNRLELEKELGDVAAALTLMCNARDVNRFSIAKREAVKTQRIKHWLHHQDGK